MTLTEHIQSLRDIAVVAERQVVVRKEWRKLDDVFGPVAPAIGRLIRAMPPAVLLALLDVAKANKRLVNAYDRTEQPTTHNAVEELRLALDASRNALNNLNGVFAVGAAVGESRA